ncbi:hypothetical protein Q0N88_14915 [Bacillus thuringiensis]
MLRYSLLVLLGACSYGILAIFVKLAYAEGFSLGEVIGSQYWFFPKLVEILKICPYCFYYLSQGMVL